MAKKHRPQNRTATQAMIDLRRSLVAGLLARVPNLSIRGVLRVLASAPDQPGHVNPATRRPWSHSTIHEDVNALRVTWRAQAEGDAADWRGKVIATFQEAVAEGFRRGELNPAIRATAEVCKVLGLYAPEKIEMGAPSGERPFEGMSDAEILREIQGFMETNRGKGRRGKG